MTHTVEERLLYLQRLLDHHFPTVDFFRIEKHSHHSLILRFSTHVNLMLSVAYDRDLEMVFCESSVVYPTGAIGAYPGMPDVLYSWEETVAEIYRFYFLMFCVSKIGRKIHLFAIPKKRRTPSLRFLSMASLSTYDMQNLRQNLCLCWA